MSSHSRGFLAVHRAVRPSSVASFTTDDRKLLGVSPENGFAGFVFRNIAMFFPPRIASKRNHPSGRGVTLTTGHRHHRHRRRDIPMRLEIRWKLSCLPSYPPTSDDIFEIPFRFR